MTQSFGFLSDGQTQLTQPNAAGEKLILRSTGSSDVDAQVTLSGLVGSSQTAEDIQTNLNDGRIEVESIDSFKSLNQVKIIGPLIGDLSVYGQGAAAQGRLEVISVPSDGDALVVTLGGQSAPAYRFCLPGRGTIDCNAASTLSQGDYFDIVFGGSITWRFWFDLGPGTGAPATPGVGGIVKVTVGAFDDAATVCSTLNAAIGASAAPVAVGLALGAQVLLTAEGLLSFGLNDGTAATGFTFTVVEASGASTSATKVRTGWNADGTDCTAAQVAANLAAAINASGSNDGTDYSGDGQANPYLSGARTDYTVVITDRLAVNRLLGWNVVQSVGASLAVVPMVGGVNGTTLATLPAGTTLLYDPFSLDTPDLGDATLPALLTPACDAINVGSSECELHIKMENAGSSIEFQLEWTDDPALGAWATCSETSAAISINNKPTTVPYILQITSVRPEYLRLVITSNPNSAAIALDARVNYSG